MEKRMLTNSELARCAGGVTINFPDRGMYVNVVSHLYGPADFIPRVTVVNEHLTFSNFPSLGGKPGPL